MGVKGLREAFNSVAAPAFTCTLALLDYKRAHDVESQILTFAGSAADGTPFQVTSEALRPQSDVIVAAKTTAQQMLDQLAQKGTP